MRFLSSKDSIHRLDATDCYLQMTKERATELADVVGEFEGQSVKATRLLFGGFCKFALRAGLGHLPKCELKHF